MKTNVALLLLGFTALANASGLRKLQQIPIRSYGSPAAPPAKTYEAPVEKSYDEPAEPSYAAPVVPETKKEVEYEAPKPVAYKAATRIVEKAPIRIQSGYGKVEESAPVVRGGGYGAAELRKEHEEYAEEQANNAQYSFASAVDDGIMDHSHVRQESREGKKVTGSYAYSDGYFKRTVNYEADENGYRVVGENVEPISETGPVVDLINGKADVHTQIGGIDTQYSVSAEDIALLKKKSQSNVAHSY